MDTAERLEDEEAGVVDEVVETRHQEEVVGENLTQKKKTVHSRKPSNDVRRFSSHSFAFEQLLLCAVEVEVDVEALEELGDGVAVHVRLLLNDLHQVLENRLPPLVGDDSGGQVAQDVRTHRLDCVQIPETQEVTQCRTLK